MLRRDTLDLRQAIGVGRELQERGGLDAPHELGVGRFVAPGPEPARAVDANEKVGMPSPASVEERRLVDRIGAGAHRVDGPGLGVVEVLERPGRIHGEPRDDLALALEALEQAPLVLEPLFLHEIEQRIVVHGPAPVASCAAQLERCQVLARKVPDEVGGAQYQSPFEDLHG